MALRIGTSGYQYDHWRGILYPAELPKSRWLERYCRSFDTVEINNTFYRLPGERAFDGWREGVPGGFLFAVKFSRFGSHLKKLKDPENTVERFVTRARHLEAKLGPVLVQLPPRWRADPERLEGFLAKTPRDIRWAIEFRDASWLSEDVYAVLRAHRAALCMHDKFPQHPEVITARWTYIRYHGAAPNGCYERKTLRAEARRIEGFLAGGLDVYAYFNNDIGGHAVRNALELKKLARAGDRG